MCMQFKILWAVERAVSNPLFFAEVPGKRERWLRNLDDAMKDRCDPADSGLGKLCDINNAVPCACEKAFAALLVCQLCSANYINAGVGNHNLFSAKVVLKDQGRNFARCPLGARKNDRLSAIMFKPLLGDPPEKLSRVRCCTRREESCGLGVNNRRGSRDHERTCLRRSGARRAGDDILRYRTLSPSLPRSSQENALCVCARSVLELNAARFSLLTSVASAALGRL